MFHAYSKSMHTMQDSIAVSLFLYYLAEFDKYSIRQQDPNIYSDTEARCLVYTMQVQFHTSILKSCFIL